MVTARICIVQKRSNISIVGVHLRRKVPLHQDMYTTYFTSPLGLIQIQATDDKIVSLEFIRRGARRAPDILSQISGARRAPLRECIQQLKEYFSGKRKKFDLPIEMTGTDFQKSVWKALQKIPYGKTMSYKGIAEKIGNPKAMRAVGNANNKNKLPLIIPCHRVIGANGKLVGFACGLDKKEWLLQLEQKNEHPPFHSF